MSNISDSSYHNFLTGEVVDATGSPTGADLNPLFKIFQTAINDNYSRILNINAGNVNIPTLRTDVDGLMTVNANRMWDDAIIDIGSRLTGETTDDGRMDRAIAAALAMPSFATIRLRANESLTFTKMIVINAARYGIIGHMTFFRFLGLTDDRAVWIYADNDGAAPPPTGTDPDYTSAYKSNNTALAGVIIVGADSKDFPNTHKGLVLGHDVQRYNAFFEVSEVSIQGFGQNGNIVFMNNLWKVQLDKIMSRWGINIIPAGIQNFGEGLNFTRSMFEASSLDGLMPGWKIGGGTVNFQYCSFDNCNVEVSGDAVSWFNQCHFERPGSAIATSYRLSIISKDSAAILDNCIIVPPGSDVVDFKDPFFYVDDTNTNNGLVLTNCKFFTSAKFKPYWNAKKQVLVGGKGRVQVNNFLSWFNAGTNPNAYVISEYLNVMHNGDAEAANNSGWVVSGGGTFSAFTTPPAYTTPPVSGDPKFGKTFGSVCFSATAPTGTTVSAYQEFEVRPGQQVLATYWRKTVITGTGTFTRELKFYAKSGIELLSTTSSVIGASADWDVSYSNMYAVAPTGAVFVRLIFTSVGVGGTTTGYVDDIIMNIL